jgi:hypothetical protein
VHPLAERLAQTFQRDFAAADREITWLAAEKERSLALSPNTILVGRVDAEGINSEGQLFFGEWKTMSNYRARYMDEEKAKWRSDPQALTYGVLVPETSLFTVRWAIKPYAKAKDGGVCTTDFEWYRYSQSEIEHWRRTLLAIADEIRARRKMGVPWLTNFNNCYRYGMKYACPFIDRCHHQRWQESMNHPRTPHLKIEPTILLDNGEPDLVILDASRTGDYLDCPESYRSKWEGEGYQEESEALTIGTDFHAAISSAIKTRIKTGDGVHSTANKGE